MPALFIILIKVSCHLAGYWNEDRMTNGNEVLINCISSLHKINRNACVGGVVSFLVLERKRKIMDLEMQSTAHIRVFYYYSGA